MDFLTSILWEILKNGLKITTDYLQKKLFNWNLSNEELEKIKEIANSTPDVYLKSEGMLKEYLKMDKELQNILKLIKPNVSITQNITENTGVAINAQEHHGDINFYSNTAKPHKTLNSDFKIIEQYSEYSPIQMLSSFKKTRDICIIKTLNNGCSFVSGNIDIPQSIKNLPGCQFSMMLFSFSPSENWVSFCKEDYFLCFDLELSKGISQVQFQVKNSNHNQFIDFPLKSGKFCKKLSELAKEHSWQDINEICFTVFADDQYITEENGYIKVSDFVLRKN